MFVSAIPFIIANIVILFLIYEIFQDYAYRLSYWRSMGFTPHTTYSLFFFVTTATKGSTYIPGQLTLDWTQVLAVILVIMDLSFLVGLLRHRSRVRGQTPEALAGQVSA